MRAFVALIPPGAALDELADAVDPLRASHTDLRWTPPAQWHLTLAFLGQVDDGRLPELTTRLERVAHRHPPLRLVLAGAGRFGDRVLWTRVLPAPAPPNDRELSVSARRVVRSGTAKPASEHARSRATEELRRLAASTAAAARRSGVDVDRRAYRPHITLARSRRGDDLRPAVERLAAFTGSPWTADALHLVRSRLGAGPGGTAAHDVIATWPLGRDSGEGVG